MGKEVYSHTVTTYVLRSTKGDREIVCDRALAHQAAREMRDELRPPYGVSVELKNGDGTVLYVAN